LGRDVDRRLFGRGSGSELRQNEDWGIFGKMRMTEESNKIEVGDEKTGAAIAHAHCWKEGCWEQG
jgi:hypothetical protein